MLSCSCWVTERWDTHTGAHGEGEVLGTLNYIHAQAKTPRLWKGFIEDVSIFAFLLQVVYDTQLENGK